MTHPPRKKRPTTRSTHTHRLFDFLKSDAVTGGRFRRRCALYGSKPAGQHFFREFLLMEQTVLPGPRLCQGCASGQQNFRELSLADLKDKRAASGQLEGLIADLLAV